MAGRGKPPLPPGQKVRRNKEPKIVLPPPAPPAADAAGIGPPPLPPYHRRGGRWHPRTVAWWRAIATWPQAATFLPSDWDHLADTAVIKDALVRDPDNAMKYLPELRLRMSMLGATVTDRQRLRMTLGEDKPVEPPAGTASLDKRRAERARLSQGG